MTKAQENKRASRAKRSKKRKPSPIPARTMALIKYRTFQECRSDRAVREEERRLKKVWEETT